MNFYKAHAYGNDFLYVRQEDVAGFDGALLARELCARHTGVGADGLILYVGDARHCRMTLFNADGGRAEVSGNGLRGLGALLQALSGADDITVETDAGIKRLVSRGQEGSKQFFRASMGAPSNLEGDVRLHAAGEDLNVVIVHVGNPHCVMLGPLPDEQRCARIGAALEHHARFPGRTNVEFVHVETPEQIRIWLWERGVGPTTSSGTGSCASLVAAAAFGGASRDATVVAPGGSQRVEWCDDGVYLTGWAEIICRGEWTRDLPA